MIHNMEDSLKKPIPDLPDHVLLHIFANLNLDGLDTIAKCSRLFLSLAQRTFSIALDGQLRLSDLSAGKINDILRTFGPLTKHLTNLWPLKTPMKWQYLDITILKSMQIDAGLLDVEHLHHQRSVFEQLESLELRACGYIRDDFNFRQWCPALKSLTLGSELRIDTPEEYFPCTLRSLDMDIWVNDSENKVNLLLCLNSSLENVRLRMHPWCLDPNQLLDLMFGYGLHKTLKSFTLIIDYFGFEEELGAGGYQLSSKVAMYQQLKKMEIQFHMNLCVIENVPLLQSLTNLEYLKISAGHEVPEAFFMAFAVGTPPNLNKFAIKDGFFIFHAN